MHNMRRQNSGAVSEISPATFLRQFCELLNVIGAATIDSIRIVGEYEFVCVLLLHKEFLRATCERASFRSSEKQSSVISQTFLQIW